MRQVRRAAVLAGVVGGVVATPAKAWAHAIGGRSDLPVPLEYFIVGAGLVLVLSFVALALLWPEPRLQDGPRNGTSRPGPSRLIGRVLGVLALFLVIGQLIVPLFGLEREPTRPTIALVTVWVLFWLVVPYLSALVGNWYADLNPWRTLAMTLDLGKRERPRFIEPLGVWPAAVLFVAFTWLELISPSSGDANTLATAAFLYTIFIMVMIALVGRETALVGFDPFTTYNRLMSAIAPVGRSGTRRVVRRGWLRALPVVPEWPGLWVFVIAMIGTVTYDGASGTEWFTTLAGGLDDTMLGRSVLLVASVAVVAIGYLAACAAADRLGEKGFGTVRVAQRFAHTLVPIALAYAFSHYFTLILFEGQQLIATLSDPLGLGWDLFGTAERRVDFFITTTDPIWYIQVASIVVGHILGVVLAHDRAIQDFGREAVRSQYAMLVFMIALTSLGLAILAG